MPYKTIPVRLVGGSNPNRTKSMSSERVLNMYPEPVPSGAYPSVLLPWPGSKAFDGAAYTGDPRGTYTHLKTGTVYKVVGTTLYSVNISGVEASIGTISGTGLVLFDSVEDTIGTPGTKLLITSITDGYVLDVGTSTLTQITDASYYPGGSVVSLSGYVVYQLNDNKYAVADVGDPLSIQGDNISTATSVADDIVQIQRFRETIYMMGSRSVEPYYVGSGGANPLVSIQSGTSPIGLIERGCSDSNENALYIVGNDKILYRTNAYEFESVTTPSMAGQLSKIDFTGARVRCLKVDGQNFVLILTSTKTFAYCETANLWIELAYTEDELPYIAYDVTTAYGKNLIQSRLNGVLLELDLDTFTDNGEIFIREVVTAPINGAQLGKEGGRFLMKRAELIMESGVGNTASENPLVMVSHSVDFGQTFSNEKWIRAGRNSENNIRVEYYAMASFRNIQFKIRTSDANFFNFHSLAADVRVSGW